MEERAYAKLNLALHVRGRRADGYHDLDTVFAFAEDGDALRVEPGEALSLRVTGPFAAALGGGGDNLVLRAARALAERFSVRAGASLILDKRLPVAAGIGGGSADAAAALRLLDRFWGLGAAPAELSSLARELGADVPACLKSQPCRGTGRGDVLVSAGLGRFARAPLLLVNPRIALATAAVFGRWQGPGSGPLPHDPAAAGNDLEAAATALVPEVGDILEALRRCDGAMLVRMSGSGATCFALFEDEDRRDTAAAALAEAHPTWWRLSSRLR